MSGCPVQHKETTVKNKTKNLIKFLCCKVPIPQITYPALILFHHFANVTSYMYSNTCRIRRADVSSESFQNHDPVLDELAARMKHRDDVVVAKLDYTVNDTPGFKTALYSKNCKLFPKGGGEVL